MKRKLFVSIFAILGIAAAGLIAAPDGDDAKGKGKGKGKPSPEARAEMMIKKADKDADGKLDKAELTAFFAAQSSGKGSKGGKGGKGGTPKS